MTEHGHKWIELRKKMLHLVLSFGFRADVGAQSVFAKCVGMARHVLH